MWDTDLSHVCDHAEGDIREGLMQVATNHTDPGERVSGVRPGFIQSHHMSQVRQLCILLLLLQTYLQQKEWHMYKTFFFSENYMVFLALK